jgi:hypothetical protein
VTKVSQPASEDVQPLSGDALHALLDELLAAERAGVKVAAALRDEHEPGPVRALLDAVRGDEAESCALLAGALGLLGAPTGSRVGDFAAKVLALHGRRERFALLQRGQRWVVRRVEEALPKITHAGVALALRRMLDLHLVNVAAAEQLLASWPEDASPAGG